MCGNSFFFYLLVGIPIRERIAVMRKFSSIPAFIFIMAILACTVTSMAQSNELAVTIGGYFPVNSRIDADNALAIGGSYARRMASVPFVSLYFELPIYATFDSTA